MAEQKNLWYEEDLDVCMNCGQSRGYYYVR